jgi:MFS family permease
MGLAPYGADEIEAGSPPPAGGGLSLSEALRTHQFWLVAVTFFCLGYAIFTISVHIVPHVTDLGISAATAASILGLIGAAQTVGGVVLGGSSDRIGNRPVIIISLGMIAAGMFWLIPSGAAWMFFPFAVVYGLGVGGGGTMEPAVVTELFGMKSNGLILGVVSFVFTIGGAIGPVVTGYVFDTSGSYNMAFVIAGTLAIVGVVLTLILRPIRQPGS